MGSGPGTPKSTTFRKHSTTQTASALASASYAARSSAREDMEAMQGLTRHLSFTLDDLVPPPVLLHPMQR